MMLKGFKQRGFAVRERKLSARKGECDAGRKRLNAGIFSLDASGIVGRQRRVLVRLKAQGITARSRSGHQR